ncbi:aldo/keto reductase [Cereibacter sediminicola]|uniref:aldo/keto reductase n=1 Tax=Cereibacter sediminicola TaxID=2584941 RepID=UPI0011A45AFA|nr:aldo/keto reductase [Cereibacter sediminicola]
MKLIPLGRTDLTVSEFCLGTMTWGSQNSEAEAHAQIDLALDQGVNFLDTAEMYPTNPVLPETAGRTETIIGNWLAARGGRDRIVLASKITGEGSPAVRDGEPVTPASLRRALEGALGRLKTDHVDLYQIHWPNRGSYHFRKMWSYTPPAGAEAVRENMLAVLEEAQALVAEGKVRHIGLSNETVWGAAQWLSLADRHGLPRMATIQNEYSLLCRQFDTDWAELSVLEEMPLLAYSPLAAGLLSGKYAGDVTPDGSRRERNATLGGRVTPTVFEAVAGYLGIAARHGLDPCQMALAFCRTRPFPVIPIIGATSLDQLRTNLGAARLVLDPEVLAEIAAARRAWPAPF